MTTRFGERRVVAMRHDLREPDDAGVGIEEPLALKGHQPRADVLGDARSANRHGEVAGRLEIDVVRVLVDGDVDMRRIAHVTTIACSLSMIAFSFASKFA